MTTSGAHDLLIYMFTGGGWLAVGALTGAFYFLTLRWTARMFATGRTLPLALAIQLLRFAVMTAVLAGVAIRFGALPLLITAAGVLLMRTVIVGGAALP